MSRTYVAASSVDEAVSALAGGARAIAGGTDLVVGARHGKAPIPQSLVAIHDIASLRGISGSGGGVRLGALASHEEIVDHPVIREHLTALADASAIVGSHATRHVGTIGGNIMNASPAMESGGPLMCLGATVELQSTSGTRTVAVDELFTGPGRTIAQANELLVSVDVPAQPAGTGSCYCRLEYRRQMEIAIVGATAVVTVVDGQVTAARIAITALAPTIRRVPEAEAALIGTNGGRAAANAAAALAAAAAAPISDVRGSADYRRAMAAVMTRRAIEAAVARATGESVSIPASPALHGAV